MGDWKTLAAAHVFVGFEICVLGMMNSGAGAGGGNGARVSSIFYILYIATYLLHDIGHTL